VINQLEVEADEIEGHLMPAFAAMHDRLTPPQGAD
jgi:hypothetical protein